MFTGELKQEGKTTLDPASAGNVCQGTWIFHWSVCIYKTESAIIWELQVNLASRHICKYGACMLSSVWLFAAPWTIDLQVPLSMEFSRQEYWSGLPFPSLGDLPHPGVECRSPKLADVFFTTGTTWCVRCECAQWLQFCLSLWDHKDCSPQGFSAPMVLQARILEWVAMPFSRGSSQPRDQTHISCISCIAVEFFTHWTIGKPVPIWTPLQIWIS